MLRWLLLEITCLLLGTPAHQPNVGWRGQVMCPLHSDCWPVTYSCEGFVLDLVCNPLLSQPGPPRAMRSGSYDYWSLVHPLSSLPLARLTSTPWTKVGYDGHGLAPLPWVLDGQLRNGLPQARAPVLGVRFSSAWCCATSENCAPLHSPAITSLGNSACHGPLRQAYGLMAPLHYTLQVPRPFAAHSTALQRPGCCMFLATAMTTIRRITTAGVRLDGVM